jgi:hypothetical protein
MVLTIMGDCCAPRPNEQTERIARNLKEVEACFSRVRRPRLGGRGAQVTAPEIRPPAAFRLLPPKEHAAHFDEVLMATAPFRGLPLHTHAGYSGPWIEDLWIQRFMRRPLAEFGGWTPIFVQWVDATKLTAPDDVYARIVAALERVLRPDIPYVTVSQADFGLRFGDVDVSVRFPQLLVLSSGGYGHVPLPLLKGEVALEKSACVAGERSPAPPGASAPADAGVPARAPRAGGASPAARPTPDDEPPWRHLLSFVGRAHFGRGPLVSELESVARPEMRLRRYRGPRWQATILESKFYLAPRAYGRTSFQLYEALQTGTPPVYVWDDVEWLPYKGSPVADFSRLGVSVRADGRGPGLSLGAGTEGAGTEGAERLVARLAAVPRAARQAMRDAACRVRASHFTMAGVLDQIARFLAPGARSDLRCGPLPAGPGLATFASIDGTFASIDADADGRIDARELSRQMSEVRVVVGEAGRTVDVRFSRSELSEALGAMDGDGDGAVDAGEWSEGSGVVREMLARHVARAERTEEPR